MAIKIHVRTNILTANLRMSVRVVLCYNFTWLPVGGGGGGGYTLLKTMGIIE